MRHEKSIKIRNKNALFIIKSVYVYFIMPRLKLGQCIPPNRSAYGPFLRTAAVTFRHASYSSRLQTMVLLPWLCTMDSTSSKDMKTVAVFSIGCMPICRFCIHASKTTVTFFSSSLRTPSGVTLPAFNLSKSHSAASSAKLSLRLPMFALNFLMLTLLSIGTTTK